MTTIGKKLGFAAASAAVLAAWPSGQTLAQSPQPAVAETAKEAAWEEPDLSSPEAVKAFLKSYGVSDEVVERTARLFDLTVEQYYDEAVRRNAEPVDAQPGVEFVDGRIKYNATVRGTMTFDKESTRSQKGERVEGNCTFPELTAGGDGADDAAMVSEVIELDPANCTRIIFDGIYNPKTAFSKMPAGVQGEPTQMAPAMSPVPPPCYSQTEAPTPFDPGLQYVDGERRRHYKQSFVDPVCIAITSTSLNVRWKNAFNNQSQATLLTGTTVNAYYFEQLGEQWIVNNLHQFPANSTSFSSGTLVPTARHTRTETQFPEHLMSLALLYPGTLGISVVLLACGIDYTADTVFSSYQRFELGRNGSWGAFGSGSVEGACTSLIHERVWHDWGYAK